MNAPYAPTAGKVRDHYAENVALNTPDVADVQRAYSDAASEFDRFITSVKAEARRQGQEDGWLRGYQLGATHALESAPHAPDRPPNPYRTEDAA